MAMKEYDQLEVMPIFQAMLMMMWMLGGMVVLNEIRYYSAWQLFGIFISICVCCTGIKIILMKVKSQRTEASRMVTELSSPCGETDSDLNDEPRNKDYKMYSSMEK